MKRLLMAFFAAVLAGCATVQVSDEGGQLMADVENTCWKFLMFIPLGSGDAEAPNLKCCRWFTNQATVENNMKILGWAMQKKGAVGVREVTTRFDEDDYSFLLRRVSCRTSAELILPAKMESSK